jgi:membrane associated rhomboid family serine protease
VIPIRDDIAQERAPIVCYMMMALCSIMFALQLWSGQGNGYVVERMGMVPSRISALPGEPVLVPSRVAVETPFGTRIVDGVRPLEPAAVPEWLTLLTCVFLHGGWLHFLGNMWFLYVFGSSVEARLGHATFAALYLGTGIVAGLAHFVVNFDSTAPTIGASGAIAGVMGAYLWMFPRAKVLTVIPLVFLWPAFVLPAPMFLTLWFVLQFWNGTVSVNSSQAAGVAWWAHIGGFIAGLACAAALGGTLGVAESHPGAEEASL